MKYIIDDQTYNVIINKKNIKNTYVRIDNNLNIIVNTNYLTTQMMIRGILDHNHSFLKKNIKKRQADLKRGETFYFLGTSYDIIILATIKETRIIDNKIYTKDMKTFNKWLLKEAKRVFLERLDYNMNSFQITKPILKIRNMKSRWGVCNRRNWSITLNLNLINKDLECIDYVIIHELSHFIHFNHSDLFWQEVSSHMPNYKSIRKKLKEDA